MVEGLDKLYRLHSMEKVITVITKANPKILHSMSHIFNKRFGAKVQASSANLDMEGTTPDVWNAKARADLGCLFLNDASLRSAPLNLHSS